jgi:hypothetical protein
MVHTGEVPSVVIGGMRRIPVSVVEKMLAPASTETP